MVGEIPAGLPRFSWPEVGFTDVLDLLPVAVGIAVMGFSDAILVARSLVSEPGERGTPIRSCSGWPD